MTLKIPAPRLLPTTIAMVAVLLLLKSGRLLLAITTHGPKPDATIVNTARAASTEQSPDAAPPPVRGKPAPAPDKPRPTVTAADLAPSPAPPDSPPISDSERALLQDLRQRRKELDARADAVRTRESVLAATEQKLTARLSELQTLQKKLEGLDAAQKQKEDTGWQGLVKVYEAMKPKDAANIFNDLQMPVLLQVMDRMKDAKAAAVMAAMNPDKARDLTAELAKMRTGRDAGQTTLPTPTGS